MSNVEPDEGTASAVSTAADEVQDAFDSLTSDRRGWIDEREAERDMSTLAALAESHGALPAVRSALVYVDGEYRPREGVATGTADEHVPRQEPIASKRVDTLDWLLTWDPLAWRDLNTTIMDMRSGAAITPVHQQAMGKAVPLLMDEIRAQIEMRKEIGADSGGVDSQADAEWYTGEINALKRKLADALETAAHLHAENVELRKSRESDIDKMKLMSALSELFDESDFGKLQEFADEIVGRLE